MLVSVLQYNEMIFYENRGIDAAWVQGWSVPGISAPLQRN